MGNIGSLNFRIGGDDKELRKIFEARKKDAMELQRLVANLKLGTTNTKQQLDVVKILERQNKLIISNANAEKAKVNAAAASLIAEQRVNDAIERGKQAKLQTLRVDNDRLAAEERLRTASEKTLSIRRMNSAQLAAIGRESSARELVHQQRLLTEIQRTEAAKRRAALVGASGQNAYNRTLGITNKTLFNQRALLAQISNSLGIYFSIYQAGAFVRELAKVSGEFEKQRLSLAAILQDKEAADKIFGQIKDLAVYSPFNFKELTDYAKQLSAFSIPANELFDTMKRLADISAGLGVDMGRIILAYGQVRSAAVLRGQELRQFTEAGIPLVDELAKKFGVLENRVVSAGEVFDKISNREVPFAMIKEIFEDLTSQGGKFFNMQQIQATSLAGMISNLRDAYDIMLDSIGEANRDFMKGAVGGLVNLMENWEKYWNILKGIILTYGTYKAAVFAMTTGIQVLSKVQNAYNLIMLGSAISGSKLSAVIDMLTTKFNNLSKATKVGLILSAIVSIGYAIKTVYDNANKLDNELSAIAGKFKGEADASVISLENLLIRLKNANKHSSEYRAIIEEINKQYGEFLPNLLKESDTYDEIEKKLKNVTAAIYEKAKAQSYSQSIQKIESNLSESISKAYDSAMKSLTTKPKMGYGQYVLSKEDANKVVSDMFAAIRQSPELYKQEKEVEKLISQTMTRALKGKTDKTSFQDLSNFPQLEGMIKGVKSYAKEMSILPELQQEAFGKNEALYGANENYAKSIGLITRKYEALNSELSKKTLNNEQLDSAMLNNQLMMLTEMLTVYKQFGQEDLARKMSGQIQNLVSANEGWRKELSAELNSTIVINAETNLNEVVEDMKKKYKDLKTRVDEQKPILIKVGYDFQTNAFPAPLLVSDSMQQLAKNFQTDINGIASLEAAAKKLGMTLSDLFTPKEKKTGSGSKKDKFTEDLKTQVDLIKEAKKHYEGLRKVMSKEDAAKSLKSIDEFKNVDVKYLSDEGYVDYLREQLKKIEKKNSDTAKNVRIAWNKEMGGIQIESLSRNAERELKKIEKFLSQYKEQYSLYEQIFDITGDKGQAAQFAFGDPSASVATYIETMKEKLKEMPGGGIYEELLAQDQSELPDAVRDLVENIKQSIQEQDFALKIDVSKIIAEYASTQDKITLIHNKYEKEREKLRNGNLSDELKNKAIAAYDQAEEEEIRELQEQLLQLAPFYKKLFGDLSEIGYRHLKKLAKYADDIVDKIANTTNEDGKLTYGKYDERNPDKLTGYYLPNEDGSLSNTIISLREYEKIIKQIASIHKDMRKQNPFDSLLKSFSQYKDSDGNQMETFDILALKATDLNSIVQELSGSLSGMFDALGNEDAADTTAFIGEMVGAATNIASGIASGNPVQVIQGIVGGITSIAQHHDKKLDKAIKKSQIEVKKLQNAYTDLQTVVSRQLGAMTSKQADDQLKNLQKQQRELESQRQNEKDKKKTDWGAVADYEGQINELKDQIRYFYEDLAGEQFGVKIKDWAKNISDSLAEAWSKGEDAAEAFDKTVADIMKSVFKNVLQLQYIEPAMEKLRTYLFGTDGKGGVLGDGEMSRSDMNGIVKELTDLKGNLTNWQKAWDYLTNAAKQAGIDLEESTASDTLSKGIQGVTEDTANVLASYMNAMRADLSMQRSMVEKILLHSESSINTLALIQADIMLIQVNTLLTANNTKRLVELSEDTNSILRNASTSGSGTRFNIV